MVPAAEQPGISTPTMRRFETLGKPVAQRSDHYQVSCQETRRRQNSFQSLIFVENQFASHDASPAWIAKVCAKYCAPGKTLAHGGATSCHACVPMSHRQKRALVQEGAARHPDQLWSGLPLADGRCGYWRVVPRCDTREMDRSPCRGAGSPDIPVAAVIGPPGYPSVLDSCRSAPCSVLRVLGMGAVMVRIIGEAQGPASWRYPWCR